MKNKGFSLIELIVVIAIIAVLVGVIVPQFSGYTNRAKESVAKDEVYNVVKIANINLMENEASDKYSFVHSVDAVEATDEFVDETTDKSEANGTVSSMLVALSSVTYTKYTSKNGVTAIYDITQSPNIYIEEGEENQVVLTEYYDMAKTVLNGIEVDDYTGTYAIAHITHELQSQYADANGGELPDFTDTDAWTTVESLMDSNSLTFHSGFDIGEIKWIPSSTDDRENVIMYAGLIVGGGTSGNIRNAGIAYYDGNYYYHIQGYYQDQINGDSVGDAGADTVTLQKLAASPVGTQIEQWMKFEQ